MGLTYKEKTTIELSGQDAAFIVREDESVELVIPHGEDDDDATPPTMAVIQASLGLQDDIVQDRQKVLWNEAIEKVEKEEEQEKNGE